MSENEFLADLLGSGAKGYGRAAAHGLLSRHPEIGQRFGQSAYRGWTGHLSQRTLELSAAVLVDEPELFAAEAEWSAGGFAAREVPVDDLRLSLECLHEALLEELPDNVREIPGRYFEAALARLSEEVPPQTPILGDDSAENRLALGYLELTLSGRRQPALDLLLKTVEDGSDLQTAYRALWIAEKHVGDLWHAGHVNIAQEHFVTATTEAALTLLVRRARSGAGSDGTIVVSPVPGNIHDLGAKALAYWLEMAGWNTVYVGSQLPADDLALAVKVFEAEVLGISVALTTHLRGAVGAIRAARAARPDVKILVGGRLFEIVPELWKRLGADGSARSVTEAAAECERLMRP